MIQGERRRASTRLALAAIAAVCALATVAAVAADADEAATFGIDGIASQSLGVHFEETGFTSVAARADGGLVAQWDRQFGFYLDSGALDQSAPVRQLSQYGKAFPLANGKSLVLDEGQLTRLNSDGSVDASFGGTGTVKVGAGASAAAELPSGKILLAGTGWGGTHQRFDWVSVELINPDGSIDRGVGKNGELTLSIPYNEEGVPEIAPLGDGGALITGGRFLLELRADGSPNPGFGSEGLVTGLPRLAGAHVLTDGSVEAVGSAPGRDGWEKDFALLRYTASGKPDLAFGPEGIRRFDFGSEEEAHAVSWAADGSVIVGGSVQPPHSCFEVVGCEEAPILVAFDPQGGLQAGFGDGGVLRLAGLAGLSEDLRGSGVEALTRRPDGSIVAAGSSPPERTTAFLAAFSPQGALLPGFGEGGIVRLRRPVPATQRLAGFAALANGDLLAAGTTDVGIADAAVLVRYAGDGGLDRSFGGGAGYVSLGKARYVNGFAVDDTGQVLTTLYDYPRSQLLELRADGTPEPSFGSGGAILLPRRVFVDEVGFAAGGGAIVLGTRDVAGTTEPGVVLRFRPNGKLDPVFGHGGTLGLQLPEGGEVRAGALIAGSGKRILVGGRAGRRFALTSLLPNGRPDPRFGTGGWALASAGGAAKSLTLSRAGPHIYLAGVASEVARHPRLVLMRFDEDGDLDRGFGHHGRLTAPLSSPARPEAIVTDGDGVLVILNRGPKPLIAFGRDGRARRHRLGQRQQYVTNVRATTSRGRLILGWNWFSRATGQDTYYLARRSLGGR